jgi:hypothetical protein
MGLLIACYYRRSSALVNKHGLDLGTGCEADAAIIERQPPDFQAFAAHVAMEPCKSPFSNSLKIWRILVDTRFCSTYVACNKDRQA